MTGKEYTPGQGDPAAPPTILVVANDPKLLKLLGMALSLEFGCPVLTAQSARSAEEAAKCSRPALFILDEQFLNDKAHDLGTRLHCVAGLEHLPTLFLNTAHSSQRTSQGYPTRFLRFSWKVEALYEAVRALLGQTP